MKSKREGKPIPDWLLPNIDYGESIAMEYYYKTLCEIASNDNAIVYKELYENTLESEVWDIIGVRKRNNYRTEE